MASPRAVASIAGLARPPSASVSPFAFACRPAFGPSDGLETSSYVSPARPAERAVFEQAANRQPAEEAKILRSRITRPGHSLTGTARCRFHGDVATPVLHVRLEGRYRPVRSELHALRASTACFTCPAIKALVPPAEVHNFGGRSCQGPAASPRERPARHITEGPLHFAAKPSSEHVHVDSDTGAADAMERLQRRMTK